MTAIVVQLHGRVINVPDLTRFTTCDDVVEMVLYDSAEISSSYGIYESSCGIERRLSGRESIVKVVRSWGVDKKKFRLVVRKTENVNHNVATAAHARRKLQKMRVEQARRAENKERTTRANLNKDSKKEMKSKVILTSTTGSRIKKNRGKMDLMKRFLKDVITQQGKSDCVSRLPLRTVGDGCDDVNVVNKYDVVMNDSESAFDDASDCSSVCDLERNILEHEMDGDSACSADIKVDNTVLKCEKIRRMFSGSDVTNSGPDSEDADMESFMKTVVYESDSDEGRGTYVSE